MFWERNPVTHLTEGWVGPIWMWLPIKDVSHPGKGTQVVQPVASHSADSAISTAFIHE
jgi:hypothetical protein